jgi:hypothetical protein
MLKIGGVKLYLDGAYSIHTAALKEPYTNDLANKGILVWNETQIQELITEIHKQNLQASVHAIGDKAIEVILDAYEAAEELHPNLGLRHRIEHFMLASRCDITRAKKLGLVIMANPSEIVYYGDTMVDNLGLERSAKAWPIRRMLDSGLNIALGTDRPCAPGNPLITIQTMVQRQTQRGLAVALDQAITVKEAFKLFTLGSAYAAFEEDNKGSIEVGKYADLAVYEADPFEVRVEELAQIPIVCTIVNGRIRYWDID